MWYASTSELKERERDCNLWITSFLQNIIIFLLCGIYLRCQSFCLIKWGSFESSLPLILRCLFKFEWFHIHLELGREGGYITLSMLVYGDKVSASMSFRNYVNQLFFSTQLGSMELMYWVGLNVHTKWFVWWKSVWLICGHNDKPLDTESNWI